jgi:hypothetical protein
VAAVLHCFAQFETALVALQRAARKPSARRRPPGTECPGHPAHLSFDDVDKKTERHGRPWNYYSGVPLFPRSWQEAAMNGIIYLIGLIVVILAILSFFGLR